MPPAARRKAPQLQMQAKHVTMKYTCQRQVLGMSMDIPPCATQAPRCSSRPPLSNLASSCPRRRSRGVSCDPSASGESGPVGHCEHCMEMNIALGRAHAALVAAKLETVHYKGLEKRARTNYGQYVKLAKALQDQLDTQTSEINASARGRTQSTNAAGSGPPI
eukprot:6188776-Pleurochrysis_carterae.AAC.1